VRFIEGDDEEERFIMTPFQEADAAVGDTVRPAVFRLEVGTLLPTLEAFFAYVGDEAAAVIPVFVKEPFSGYAGPVVGS